MVASVKPKRCFFTQLEKIIEIADFRFCNFFAGLLLTPKAPAVFNVKYVGFRDIFLIFVSFVGISAEINCRIFNAEFHFVFKVYNLHHGVIRKQAFGAVTVHYGIIGMQPAAGRAGNTCVAAPYAVRLYGKQCAAVYAARLIISLPVITFFTLIFFVGNKHSWRTIPNIHIVCNYLIAYRKFCKFFHFATPSLILVIVIFFKAVAVIGFAVLINFLFLRFGFFIRFIRFITKSAEQAAFLACGFF